MTGFLRRALPLAFLLAAMPLDQAGAQPVAMEIIDGGNAVTVLVRGSRSAVVEILAPDGRLVSRSEAVTGSYVWNKRDAKGNRVGDGVYLVQVSARDSAGKPYQRTDQIMVQTVGGDALSTRSVGPITGEGRGSATSGLIARFNGAHQITNSVIIQNPAGNIGINTNALAVLHVNKARAATSQGAGTDSVALLQTSGGKGGNAVITGASGGKGAAIALFGGPGGDAVAGGTNGSGGNITLQPGSPGIGGGGGATGNVVLAPVAGNVGIGTADPQRALQIGASTDALFTLSPSDGSPRAGFIRFGDKTGWRLIIGRSRETSGGSLNTGYTGNLVTIEDNGALYQAGGYPFGVTGVQPLCRTLSNAITPCGSGAASQRYRAGATRLQGGLATVDRLLPLAFTRTDTMERTIGLAAEQTAAVDPRLVAVNAAGEPESVNYDLLTVVLVDAVKTQQRQLREQQALIDELEARLRKLENKAMISLR